MGDDPRVWHEALLLWPGIGAKRPWALYTPDKDLYVVFLRPGVRDDGPDKTALVKGGRCASVPRGQFYRFERKVTPAALQVLLARGKEEVASAGLAGQFVTEFVSTSGVVANLS